MYSKPLSSSLPRFSSRLLSVRSLPQSLSGSGFSPVRAGSFASPSFRSLSTSAPLRSTISSLPSSLSFSRFSRGSSGSDRDSGSNSHSNANYSVYLFAGSALIGSVALMPSLSAAESAPNAAPTAVAAAPLSLLPIQGEDVEIASLWRRLFAFLVDNTIISIAFQLIDLTFTGSLGVWVTPVAIVFNLCYETLLTGLNDGRTVGKYALGIRVAREDGTSVTPKIALGIWAGKLLNLFLGVDVIWALFDFSGDRKALHNRFTGTIVVRDRERTKKA